MIQNNLYYCFPYSTCDTTGLLAWGSSELIVYHATFFLMMWSFKSWIFDSCCDKKQIQETLEQHDFQLCGSTDNMDFFPHKYRGPPTWTDLPLFYIGDLSICEFWYLWGWGGRMGAIPGTNGYEGTTQVFGTDELDGTAPLNPHVIQGPTV